MLSKYFDINEAGHSIKCKLYYKDVHTIRRVIIFGHGFGGHKDNKAAEKFAERAISKLKDVAMVVPNWPCHGDDVKQKLRLEDCDAYISLVIEYIKKNFNTDDMYVYATSFGGYLFLKYIHEHGNPFRKLALRCPAVSIHEDLTRRVVTAGDMEKLQKGKDVLIGFDRKVKVNKTFFDELEANDIRKWDLIDYADYICIIHGMKDEIVPFDTAKEFAENNIIEFYPIENADHRFMNPRCMDTAMQIIYDWFF